MRELPFVSVIIPVWNNPTGLRACLSALASQDYPSASVEILVVDNGPTLTLGPIVERFDRTVLLHEPRPASDRARNTGLRASRGEIIAFTDSDCLPQPDWISAGVRALSQQPSPGIIAGRIRVVPHDLAPVTLAELHDLILAFPQERCVRRSHYGATANVFTRRDVFDAVGLFREDLVYGGDAEWGERVFRSGRSVVYAGDVAVQHPARRTIAELVARTRRGAGGLVQWRRDQPWLLLRDQLKDLVPPPDLVWRILTTPIDSSLFRRSETLLLFMGLRGVRFIERLRVLAGGDPLR